MADDQTTGGCGNPIDESVRQVIDSGDASALQTALVSESMQRRRAECLANIQTEITKYTLDLFAREPDLNRFFHALLKMLAEEGESHAAGVWLLNDDQQCCEFWMAHLFGEVITATDLGLTFFPRMAMADFLFAHKPGWEETIEYRSDDSRLPQIVREFNSAQSLFSTMVAPLTLGGRNLGWITLCAPETPDGNGAWWRMALVEAIARHAALALHQSRLAEQNRIEERRKAILEERNRLARDIHDNLAQGFGAILMQLQAAQRAGELPSSAAHNIETAVDLARTHLVEARRSVGALRPNVSDGEDLGKAIKRLAELGQKTGTIPIEVQLDELPRFGDGVEREVIGIAQEAITNAVRHSRAQRITVRASSDKTLGLRLSIADDGRGIPRERSSSGFGMTSMQERADRIGASLTIVTAPRSGTEVVLAWQPSSLPTQVHAHN
jgi:signal transduction histidine kinase